MTVSMRVMSAGAGYRYLLDSVAVGDVDRESGRPLVDYYTVQGCPPGRWLGSGLVGLDGQLQPGGVVAEEQVARLLGSGCDPTSGAALGRPYPRFVPTGERIAGRTAALPADLDELDRGAAVERIVVEERGRGTRRAVAGFDLTFSVPKSVSVLWALAGPDVRAEVVAAHHAAIDDVIGLVEREVAATRMGATGPDGPVAQVDVVGVIAAAFDHYDSRAGDPQLHTHVVIANKVQTVCDGRWRALDGRPVHAAVVALSEHYNAVLADHLTSRLGITWRQRDRGTDRNTGWEITGIPDQLLDRFSSRTGGIEQAKDRLIADYVATHGRQPSARTVIRLRQQATLESRPDKQLRSLATLTTGWRTTATRLLGGDPVDWARRLLAGGRVQQRLHAAAVSDATVDGIAATVVGVVGERRSTWRRWNLHAEASRQLQGVRFATTTDREHVLRRIVHAAEQQSLRLTPPDLAAVPVELQRSDGTSVLRPRHSTVYTSADLLTAEDDLLRLADRITAPTLPVHTIAAHADELGEDQAAPVIAIATSGRVVDVLIGPAGAGKTTTMRTLADAWTGLYGAGSVVGLAPSAAAAEVLGTELDIPADTLAKWLHDQDTDRAGLLPGQLVVVDEASLAGTRALQRLALHTDQQGAKLLLVGDPAQLAAVEAGGAFALLARTREDMPALRYVRRFHQPWEAAATLQLREGDPAVLDTYAAHGRLRDGDTDAMVDTAYTAWQHDQAHGRRSLLIAPTRQLATALNERARTDRISSGDVDPATAVRLHDDTLASIGDAIVTRRNDRRLASPSGRWVRNGDRWTITAIHPDGSITANPTGQRGSGAVRLPAEYVAGQVELGYATTAHRAQGATVDTAHAIITPTMTGETLYVVMTRGRHTNSTYTTTDTSDVEQHHDRPAVTGRQVLEQILARTGAKPSAHERLRAEQDRAGSIGQFAAEYDTIAAIAQRPRWAQLVRTSGLTDDRADAVITSDAFGPLCAALRRAEAHHLDPTRLLTHCQAGGPLDDADDVAAVLHHRLDSTLRRLTHDRRLREPQLVAGLVPIASGPMTEEHRRALDQRQTLIQQRARDILRTAIQENAPWLRDLGTPPRDRTARAEWLRHAITVAALHDGREAESLDQDERRRQHAAYRHETTAARRAAVAAAHPGGPYEPPAVHSPATPSM